MTTRLEKGLAWARRAALPGVLAVWMMCCAIDALLPRHDRMHRPFHPVWSSAPFLARRRSRRRDPIDASASYGRYSTELQDDTSIDQQQGRCRDFATGEGNVIEATLEFADEAVSGTKRYREGLDALLAAAEQGRFKNLYFYSLSRLARESVIGMPILKRLVHLYRVRVISVTEGLDSNREGWETLAQILLMQHERYVKELSAATFRGQEGIAKDKMRRISNGGIVESRVLVR